jgi:hypothetical protein
MALAFEAIQVVSVQVRVRFASLPHNGDAILAADRGVWALAVFPSRPLREHPPLRTAPTTCRA